VIDAEEFHRWVHSFLKFKLVERVYACGSILAIGVMLPLNTKSNFLVNKM